jgi:hypothetical protein
MNTADSIELVAGTTMILVVDVISLPSVIFGPKSFGLGGTSGT